MSKIARNLDYGNGTPETQGTTTSKKYDVPVSYVRSVKDFWFDIT